MSNPSNTEAHILARVEARMKRTFQLVVDAFDEELSDEDAAVQLEVALRDELKNCLLEGWLPQDIYEDLVDNVEVDIIRAPTRYQADVQVAAPIKPRRDQMH